MTAKYLRPNIQAEPLFNRWYAWTYLIPPATAAMHVANSHVKIMKSYVSAPGVHAAAVKNPAMLGGPFIDLDGKRTDEIQSLIDRTVTELAPLLELAQAIGELDRTLQTEAKGFSLEGLYARLPQALRGFVELAYDLNGAPSVRFFEQLLYRSPYYRTASQGIGLSAVSSDERPFALSTPRLPDPGRLDVSIPFASSALDALFASKSTPREPGELREALGIDATRQAQFESYFAEDPPSRAPSRYDGPGVRVRYFGHACLLVESRDVAILVDPALSYDYESSLPRYTYADLPEVIDYLLLTHNHQDHVLLECLLQIRHKVRTVLVPRSGGGFLQDPSLKYILRELGFSDVRELDAMECLEVPGGSITGVPFLGEHCDLSIQCKLAFACRLAGRTLLIAADSNNLDPVLYDHVHDAVGDTDALFLGMECDGGPLNWLYGPLLTRPINRKDEQSRRLSGSDFPRASKLVERFNPRHAYVYAMGQEPWLGFLMALRYTEASRPIVESNKLVQACRERGVQAERLYGMKEILL